MSWANEYSGTKFLAILGLWLGIIFFPDWLHRVLSEVIYWNIVIAAVIALPLSFWKRVRKFCSQYYLIFSYVLIANMLFNIRVLTFEASVYSPISWFVTLFQNITWTIFGELMFEVIIAGICGLYANHLLAKSLKENESISRTS